MAKVKADYMTIGQLPPKANRKTPAPPKLIVTPPAPSPPSEGNLKKVHEAGCFVLEYDELTGDPEYVVNGCLIPNLDHSFTENFNEEWDM
ncbi:hypothetical protein FRC09_003135 [Ceratobasidium sp. 395]|nr:hypothetical protein FRC09_003135 [Ceratobasidium sp. 395]